MASKIRMMALVLFGFVATAQARVIPVTVQCDTRGPLYDGTLTIPDQLEGKCVPYKEDKIDKSEIYQSPSILMLEFNNLTYEAINETYQFFGSTCDFAKFSGTGAASSAWFETHSHYQADFGLARYGKIEGAVGRECHFLEK